MCNFLVITLEKIAGEKAGIIKPSVPVVIGETTPETKSVFQHKAAEVNAPIIFAEEEHLLTDIFQDEDGKYTYQTSSLKDLKGELGGFCQKKNTNTLLSAIHQLEKLNYHISETDIRNGFAHVCELTGLMGRWQKLSEHPKSKTTSCCSRAVRQALTLPLKRRRAAVFLLLCGQQQRRTRRHLTAMKDFPSSITKPKWNCPFRTSAQGK